MFFIYTKYIFRQANGIYIPKSCNLQLMDSLSLFVQTSIVSKLVLVSTYKPSCSMSIFYAVNIFFRMNLLEMSKCGRVWTSYLKMNIQFHWNHAVHVFHNLELTSSFCLHVTPKGPDWDEPDPAKENKPDPGSSFKKKSGW